MLLMQQNETPLKTKTGFKTTSKIYSHISSLDICKKFQDLGFSYEGTSSAGVNSEEKNGFQKHLMSFTRDDLIINGGEKIRILCLNSHDGSSALRFNLGVFRLACANGLISGEKIHESRINHRGNISKDILEQIKFLAARANTVKNSIELMKNNTIDFKQSQEFLKFAADIRINSKNLLCVDLASIDRVRRTEDTGQDLWTVFNRVQESIIKGGVNYTTQEKRKNKCNIEFNKNVDRTTKKINSNTRIIDLNQKLWNKSLELVS